MRDFPNNLAANSVAAGILRTTASSALRSELRRRDLQNGCTLEHALQTCAPKVSCRRSIAAHESPRTTKLDDRTTDKLSLDEIERIAI